MAQTDTDARFFSQALCAWFERCGRDLPWRGAPSAYQVWVSELMLQQTRVAAVIPYYARWMARFPTLGDLARADIDEVMRLWSGLGYYRRARYLYDGARYVAEQCGGEFPRTVEGLRAVPGIGAYTAGAIASFAFGQDVAALDGNAERVYARFFGIRGDLSARAGRGELEAVAQDVLSFGHGAAVNQAVMDLGSGACGRAARCDECPIAERCRALRDGMVQELPEKKKRAEKYDEFRAALRLCDAQGRILLARRRKELLLGGLWEYPMIELSRTKGAAALTQARERAAEPREGRWEEWMRAAGIGAMGHFCQTGRSVSHTFTHIQMTVFLDSAEIVSETIATGKPAPNLADGEYDAFEMVAPSDVEGYAMSSLMRRLLAIAPP